MKKKYFFSFVIAVVSIVACDKDNQLPVVTPNPTTIFSVSSFKHTVDSVNIGDTIKLNVAGKIYDTTQSITRFLTATASSGGTIFTSGLATSPIAVTRTIGVRDSIGLYNWSAVVAFPNATYVAHKVSLTITGTFLYQLSLSSQLGTLSVADAGVKIKTVYVK